MPAGPHPVKRQVDMKDVLRFLSSAVLNTTRHRAVLHFHSQSATAMLSGEQTTKAQPFSEQGLFWV